MIDIFFEIGGRKVRPNQLGDALEKAIFQEIADSVTKSLQGTYCLTHSSRPKVKCVGRSIEDLRFEISGCCDRLVKQATDKLG